MPGIVDSHVHINEPGRTEWEGFRTATRAAAVGGITTIADMPLNSIPPTTTVDNLKTKADKARDMIYVDLAFWGGIIPGNQNELQPLVEAGVVGFKCFLCPSGVDEFPCVKEDDVNKALEKLKSTRSVLAFHAEYVKKNTVTSAKGDPTCYETFLRTRPSEMEINAIKMICHWCEKSNVRCHIVHLSTADALDLIKATKGKGAPITAETCHHYLLLSAEEVPVCATEFKCCPPIRDKVNRDKLWDGLRNKVIDMVVSDHSPCTEELKTKGNFLTAWGGISSLQFGLSLLWTAARLKSVGLTEISRLLSAAPAKLCGLNDRKGTLSVGMDADFVIWDPEKMFKVERNHILFKNKMNERAVDLAGQEGQLVKVKRRPWCIGKPDVHRYTLVNGPLIFMTSRTMMEIRFILLVTLFVVGVAMAFPQKDGQIFSNEAIKQAQNTYLIPKDATIQKVQEGIELAAYESIPGDQKINLFEILGEHVPPEVVNNLQTQIDQIGRN
ncbi:putative allantoinase 1 [Habropoda laboriosa]|uniref:allantoinase n=2 Tax=Habropoda laboriosa TaxID=597456 RepID=A0A0L7QXC8_9HYME|nr:putative allantoinase 1 [Habropoda laboriosa]